METDRIDAINRALSYLLASKRLLLATLEAKLESYRNPVSRRTFCPRSHVKEREMGNLLYWAVIFLIVALVAGVLGFGGVAGTAAQGASLLFWIAIILFVVALVAGLVRRG